MAGGLPANELVLIAVAVSSSSFPRSVKLVPHSSMLLVGQINVTAKVATFGVVNLQF